MLQPGAARARLNRLPASRTCAASERLRRFLRFSVENTLAEQADKLRERTLGLAVFERSGEYDPRIDPIVRVEERQLCAKLRTYYAQEGAVDPVVPTFPEGSYVPVLVLRAGGRPPEPETPSVAVPPFANFSAEPRQDYFCDGVTEETINARAKVEGPRVVSRNSAFQFTGRSEGIREIAAKLTARHIVEDSVRKAVSLYKQVLAGHPGYTPAWCGLTDAYGFLAYYGAASPVPVAAQVEAAVAKAFEIDDSLPEAHATLGGVRGLYEWRWSGALGPLDRAIELAPGAPGKRAAFSSAWTGWRVPSFTSVLRSSTRHSIGSIAPSRSGRAGWPG